MIKLCKSFGYKPKYGNDADSAMMRHLVSTVSIVLVCLAAISFSAYAFFSHSVATSNNTITSSTFSSSVTIKDSNGEIITEGKLDNYRFAPGKYIVTLNADSGITGTGYGVIKIADNKYYTQQLGKDINAPGQERAQVSFALDVQADTTIEIESRWGTSSFYNTEAANTAYYIKNAEPLQVITVTAASGINEEEDTSQEDGEQEATVPEQTEPETTVPEQTEPVEDTVPTEPPEDEIVTYTVMSGDTLFEVSLKYDLSHIKVAAYNNIPAPYDIHPGDVIKIPPTDWVAPTE